MAAFAGKRLQLPNRSTHTNKRETATSSLDGDAYAVSSFWISYPLSQSKHAAEHPRFSQTCPAQDGATEDMSASAHKHAGLNFLDT